MNRETTAQQFEQLSGYSSYLDAPTAGARVYGESITVSGWLHARGREADRCRVRAWIDGHVIGETRLLFVRPDVSRALQISDAIPTGFRLLGLVPSALDVTRSAELTLTASWSGDEREYEFGCTTIELMPSLLAQRPFGDTITGGQRAVLHRDNIYGSGPPIDEPGAETLSLLTQYLPPGSSVLDVGCGAGAYGSALRGAGHEWLGLEANAGCLQMLRARNLPHREVNAEAGSLPCRDSEFDSAICIEVLEHTAEPDAFLAEVSRVIRGRALFSVPNIEVIPYFSAWQVVPWHLLEADHKNFFTRASLRDLLRKHFASVEVFSYAEHPLRTPDGIPLHVHLFAIADK